MTNSEMQETVDVHVGKTVQSIEAYSSYMRINFTDGTSMEIISYGSDEGSWISVD